MLCSLTTASHLCLCKLGLAHDHQVVVQGPESGDIVAGSGDGVGSTVNSKRGGGGRESHTGGATSLVTP